MSGKDDWVYRGVQDTSRQGELETEKEVNTVRHWMLKT